MTRQQDYDARQRARGHKKVCLWVPTDKVDRLKKYADKLRKEADKK